MGLFDRFKQQKTYNLDEALSKVAAELVPMEAARRHELYQQATAVHREFGELRKALHEFSSKAVPENARSSAKVRERFCRLGEEQLTSFAAPNEDKPLDYIVEAHELINGLGGLTERQILHLGFFFRDDIVPVARKMKEINELLRVTKNPVATRRRAIDIHKEIEKMRLEVKKHEEELLSAKDTLRGLEKKLGFIEIPETNVDKSRLLAAENNLKKLKQEIDSLLSIQKLLKKYLHDTEEDDEVINDYIDSASVALEKDTELKIFGILKKVRDLDSQRIELILSKKDVILSKRQEMKESIRILNAEQASYDRLSSAAAATVMSARRQRLQVEAEIRDCKKEIDQITTAIGEKSRKITAESVELLMLLSDILKAEIR